MLLTHVFKLTTTPRAVTHAPMRPPLVDIRNYAREGKTSEEK